MNLEPRTSIYETRPKWHSFFFDLIDRFFGPAAGLTPETRHLAPVHSKSPEPGTLNPKPLNLEPHFKCQIWSADLRAEISLKS